MAECNKQKGTGWHLEERAVATPFMHVLDLERGHDEHKC
jgi:hypothetical protein